MKKLFLIAAFVYTITIICIAAYLPHEHWINTHNWLWGVVGIMPVGFMAPLAFPAFGLLVLSICFDKE